MKKQLAIINMNNKLKGIVKQVRAYGDYAITLVIETEEKWLAKKEWHPVFGDDLKLLFSDPKSKEVMDAIHGFDSVVVLRDYEKDCDAETALITVSIEEASKGTHTIAEIQESIYKEHIETLNIDEIVCIGEISEKMIAQGAITSKIEKFFNFLLMKKEGTPEVFIASLPQSLQKTLKKTSVQKNYPELLMSFMKENKQIIPIGYIKKHQTNIGRMVREYVMNPKADDILNLESDFVFIGMKERMKEWTSSSKSGK